jgi:hypothetical protein
MLPEPCSPTGQPAPPCAEPPPRPAPLPARRPGATDLSVFTTRPPGERRASPPQPWRWLPAVLAVAALLAGYASHELPPCA